MIPLIVKCLENGAEFVCEGNARYSCRFGGSDVARGVVRRQGIVNNAVFINGYFSSEIHITVVVARLLENGLAKVQWEFFFVSLI